MEEHLLLIRDIFAGESVCVFCVFIGRLVASP